MVVELTAVQSPQAIRAGVLAALVPIVAFAGSSLQQIWQVRLAETLTEPVGWTTAKSHPIVELAFSPDGRKLAVTMDDHYQAEVHKTHLLILDVQSPQTTFRQFDLETCGKFLAWAPDGGALLICGQVLRLDDGSSCDLLQTSHQRLARNLGNSSYWLTADRVIGADRTIIDLSCHPVETWAMEGDWYVAGTVPAKGWMLLRQLVNQTVNGRTFRHNDYAIADRDKHRLTSGMLFPASHQAIHTIMAEGAARVCSELVPTGGYKIVHRCWNLPDGQTIPLAPELRNYKVTQASRFSPRVVAERWGYHSLDLLKEVPDMLGLIVVDLRSGRQIASLKPRQQRDYSSGGIWNRYFQCALAPSGDLLAEGGDGGLSLYQLP